MDYLRYYLGSSFMMTGIAGFLLGGTLVWLGAGTFLILLVLDLIFSSPDFSERKTMRPLLAEVPLYLHGVLLLGLFVAAGHCLHLHATGERPLGALQLVGCTITMSWLGVLPNLTILHEFIHRRGAFNQLLGFLMSVAIGDPLRRLAHVRVHHLHFCTERDSDTPRRGETIYAFMVRAAFHSTWSSFDTERRRAALRSGSVWSWRSNVVQSMVLLSGTVVVFGAIGGPTAAAVIASAFFLSKMLLEAFNYLQHYGLVRVPGTRHHQRHSWNHLTPAMRAAGYEVTNHSHHHLNPRVPFYRLRPYPEAPQMPSAMLCFLAALIPPLWVRQIAMPRLRDWDLHHATPAERRLAAAANRAAGWPDWSSELAERAAQSASA